MDDLERNPLGFRRTMPAGALRPITAFAKKKGHSFEWPEKVRLFGGMEGLIADLP